MSTLSGNETRGRSRTRESIGDLSTRESSESPRESFAQVDVARDNDSHSSLDSEATVYARARTRTVNVLNRKLAWARDNWSYRKIQPVIRCAIAAWVSLLLFAIPKVERWIGSGSYLILISSFLSPPAEPLVAVLEREVLIIFLVTISWAWVCLGVELANLARTNDDPTALLPSILSGTYIQAAPNVITAVFVGLGSLVFLYIRARMGPGPYAVACQFACIMLVSGLTTASFFPYPYFRVGRNIIAPLGIHSCIAICAAILIFPSTASSQYVDRIQAVITPLSSVLQQNRALFKAAPGVRTPEDSPSPIDESEKPTHATKANFQDLHQSVQTRVAECDAKLLGVAAANRFLGRDFIWSRFSPKDFQFFHFLARRLVGRAHGMTTYFALIDPERETFPTRSMPNTPAMGSPTSSLATSRMGSPVSSRVASPERSPPRSLRYPFQRSATLESDTGSSTMSMGEGAANIDKPRPPPMTPAASAVSFATAPTRPHHLGHHLSQSSQSFSSFTSGRKGHLRMHSTAQGRHARFPHLLQSSLLNLTRKHKEKKHEHVVGVFESQRYLNLESKRLHDPRHEEHSGISTELLGECCDDLLRKSGEAVETISRWLGSVRQHQFAILFLWKGAHRIETARQQRLNEVKALRSTLDKCLEDFRCDARMKVLDPYRPAFASALSEDNDQTHERHHHYAHRAPAHRHLFRCFVFQYNLIQTAEVLIQALDEIVRLEETRTKWKLFTPVKRLFAWNRGDVTENLETDEDDDPDMIQGALPTENEEHMLGMPKRRDPDALPPTNFFEVIMSLLHRSVTSLWSGNSLFAIKAAFISVGIALPFFFKNSAQWAYENRWSWSVIVCQMTLARFRGDTSFGLVARIGATFVGGLIGLTMWYISAGDGPGNPYGLAAVSAVCFPVFFYIKLYAPLPRVTTLVTAVTAILILGYSYQNDVQPGPSNVGHGWDVAWRRFVYVAIGVFSAFLGSFIPPTMTLRRYQRHILSTASEELGVIYCSIVSFASDYTDYPPHLYRADTRLTDRKDSEREARVQDIARSLIATRSKLRRSEVLRTNILYEFSLQGKWPKARYREILDLEMAIAYSLSHLLSVLERLEPAWTRAFLKRACLLDPDFQGDVLAVSSMISTALRTGSALPQVTPCPLLDRFTLRHHGLDVIHRDSEEDYGLPRTLTLETLMDEQYMMFCVGISTVFGIMNRLDRLMLAVKEVVGEQYHIHGVGLGSEGVPLLGSASLNPRKEV